MLAQVNNDSTSLNMETAETNRRIPEKDQGSTLKHYKFSRNGLPVTGGVRRTFSLSNLQTRFKMGLEFHTRHLKPTWALHEHKIILMGKRRDTKLITSESGIERHW